MRRCQRGQHRLLQRTEGTSAVEFAVILPLFLLFVCGIIDFGQIYYQLHMVNEAARAGARIAAVDPNLANAATDVTTFIHSKYGNQLQVVVNPSPPVSLQPVTVRVSSSVHIITPVISAFFPSNPYTVTGTSVMQVE